MVERNPFDSSVSFETFSGIAEASNFSTYFGCKAKVQAAWKKVSENKLKSFDYGFKLFSPVNVKESFNFAIHQSKSFVMILVNTFDLSSLMLVQKQWCWVMLIVCSILFNWRLSKYLGKTLCNYKIPLPDLYHSSQSQSSNKKNWFVLETRKLQILFVVLCSFQCRKWHLNNVRAPLVAISLLWSQRAVNSVVKYVVDLSFFISPPSLSQFQNE